MILGRLITFLMVGLGFATTLAAWAQGHVMVITNETTQEPLDFVAVYECTKDSVLLHTSLSDEYGRIIILNENKTELIRCERLGFETKWQQVPFPDTIRMQPTITALSEVLVCADVRPLKKTDSGFIYNMAANRRAQDESILQALNYIPFVSVSLDGKISIKGQQSFIIYKNGKPYDIAQTSPEQILQSISASHIKSVELITEADPRFGSDGTIPIINLVTSENGLDGFYINSSGKTTTQPMANAHITAMGSKRGVDLALEYDYFLNGQRAQPVTMMYEYPWGLQRLDGKGDGDWITHTIRAMSSWNVDSIHTLYADVHGRIGLTDSHTNWAQISALYGSGSMSTHTYAANKVTSGTIEANCIYRSYFQDNPGLENFKIGYRFALNPDKRHNTNMVTDDTSGEETLVYSTTDGAIYDHSLIATGLLRPAQSHYLWWGVKETFRHGSTSSSDDSDVSYIQNITSPYMSYSGVFKNSSVWARVAFDFDYLNLKLKYDANNNFHRLHVDLIPSTGIYWNISNRSRLSASAWWIIKRPTLAMVNPFYSVSNSYTANAGNPKLNSEKKQISSLSYTYFSNTITLQTEVKYKHLSDQILYYASGLDPQNRMLYTYANMGHSNYLGGDIYGCWKPSNAIAISLIVSGGYNMRRAAELDLKQDFCSFDAQLQADGYLPCNINVSLMGTIGRNDPQPWGHTNTTGRYSLSLSKSWCSGQLFTGIIIECPFNHYIHLRQSITHQGFTTSQINYINARSLGLKIRV